MDETATEYNIVEEETTEISPLIKEISEKNRVLSTTPLCPGCGPQLGLKLALQLVDNCILVTSSGCIRLAMKSLQVPCFHAGLNAIAAASGIARSKEDKVLCYIGDGALAANLGAIISAAERNENVLCICYNNQGYCNINKPFKTVKEFARLVKAPYVATASVSHIEDYISKIKRASELSGFRFIDLFSPCPVTLKVDSSNTIEVGRLAVETGIWPLYEIYEGELSITERPRKLEPVDRYLELVKTTMSDEEKVGFQKNVNRKWKALVNGFV